MDAHVGSRSSEARPAGGKAPNVRLEQRTVRGVVGLRPETRRKQPLDVAVQPNGDPPELILWGDDE